MRASTQDTISGPKQRPNRTFEFLQQQGRNDLVQRIQAGRVSMRDALSEVVQASNVRSSFSSQLRDGEPYKTADMSGVEPSGVGERSQLNAAARSFQGFMKSLQDYERMFADGGSTAWPGKRKDELSTAHRDLQMLSKELYNLGVLNGPDLMLMDQILLDPTSLAGNVKDALGISDMEERIPANIREVRRMMTNRMTPGLQQLGIDPQSLMPPEDLSDEEFLKTLGLE